VERPIELLDRQRRPVLAALNRRVVDQDVQPAQRFDRLPHEFFRQRRILDIAAQRLANPDPTEEERAAWEVAECKRRIEEELQSSVGFFAYPNGREEDFTASNKEILRLAGYRAAVTTIWGMNYRSTDRMELRRGGPWEENPRLFSMKLDWYQLANQ